MPPFLLPLLPTPMDGSPSKDDDGRVGHVGKAQITSPVADAGATIIEAELAGRRVITESIGGQVVAKMVTPAPVAMPDALDKDAVTIGRTLEAVVAMAGYRLVDYSDAAGIQVVETCATGSHATIPGAVPAAAQSATDQNARALRDEDKVKLRNVLSNARERLPADKGATREDAERVVSAEIRNKLDVMTTPGNVSEAVSAASVRAASWRPRPRAS
ncbi:late embryogenesis abundant protein D-34-like [Miscanthus floridulus]|uniref:late embryogenesis abundant protein D-34-like n=1 Tax=Miscanthus floridulus TaxID=154761 RepID=UPI0034590492